MATSKTSGNPQSETLYSVAKAIHPADVSGTFRKIKWALLILTLGVYYFLPFVRWDRGPGHPDQAVLIDFTTRRFYFFFIEIWPQEVYYITGLLILASLVLFLMNAVAGRVWCGYLCPQTVWTDLFMLVERWVQGDRRARMKLDEAPWTVEKVGKKGLTHILWILIAWWTGGAWVLYFSDAPSLVWDLLTFQAPMVAYMWIGILTFTTYLMAGHAREQVCIYMCPWPRIQAALTDEWALNVSYRVDRGEPRGSLRTNKKLREEGQPAGECIDCEMCVQVCPTGTDIRLGMQLSCIQCGLCIDACNEVMVKTNQEPNLIAYDTDINIDRHAHGQPPIYKLVRPRTILYVGVIVVVGFAMLFALLNRATVGLNVLHDRNPIYVMNSDGSVRNGYTMRLLNKHAESRSFTLAVEGLPAGTRVDIPGATELKDGLPVLKVAQDETREIRVNVIQPKGDSLPASTHVRFVLKEVVSGETAVTKDFFKAQGS